MKELTTYSVSRGKKDFKPNNQPLFTNDRTVEWEFILDESMWFNWSEWEHHPYDGLNKLGFGLTWALSGNDNRSCMIAYFPHKTKKNWFTIYGYVNAHGNILKPGKHSFKPLMEVEAGVLYRGQTSWVSNKAMFKIESVGLSVNSSNGVELPLRNPPWWSRFVLPMGQFRGLGPWFGGRYPSPQDSSFKGRIIS